MFDNTKQKGTIYASKYKNKMGDKNVLTKHKNGRIMNAWQKE